MLLKELFESQEDYIRNTKIKTDIRKLAMNPETKIHNAISLVHYVYNTNNIEIPSLVTDPHYTEYEDNCIFAVKQLNAATNKHIRDDKWKFTPSDVPIA